jgi:hypothetical protein
MAGLLTSYRQVSFCCPLAHFQSYVHLALSTCMHRFCSSLLQSPHTRCHQLIIAKNPIQQRANNSQIIPAVFATPTRRTCLAFPHLVSSATELQQAPRHRWVGNIRNRSKSGSPTSQPRPRRRPCWQRTTRWRRYGSRSAPMPDIAPPRLLLSRLPIRRCPKLPPEGLHQKQA